MTLIEAAGWTATIVTIAGVVAPKRENLHLSMAVANGLWLFYGLLRKDAPLVAVSAVLVIMHLWAKRKRK